MASQVLKVRVMDPGTHEQHITDFNLSGGFIFTKEQMIISLRMSPDTYYTNADGKIANLIIAKTENGHEYVKTKADSTRANNLLSLPRF